MAANRAGGSGGLSPLALVDEEGASVGLRVSAGAAANHLSSNARGAVTRLSGVQTNNFSRNSALIGSEPAIASSSVGQSFEVVAVTAGSFSSAGGGPRRRVQTFIMLSTVVVVARRKTLPTSDSYTMAPKLQQSTLKPYEQLSSST